MLNIKELKKLANACRKAGVQHLKVYQDGSYEFDLDANYIPQTKIVNKKVQKPNEVNQDPIASEGVQLTPEQLLFFSVREDQIPNADSDMQS